MFFFLENFLNYSERSKIKTGFLVKFILKFSIKKSTQFYKYDYLTQSKIIKIKLNKYVF